MKKIKGFTLIEILLVLAILSVLVSVAILEIYKYREVSYKTLVKIGIRNTLTSIYGYNSQFLEFPDNGSCGPGPAQCNLSNGTYLIKDAILVSDGVIIKWTIIPRNCSNGDTQVLIEGKHINIQGWQLEYDSCTGHYTEINP